MAICGIKECFEEVAYLGMCQKHWRRNRQFGSPFALKAHSGAMKGLSAIERFNKQHTKDGPNGCWEWTACVDRDGYGKFRGMVGTVAYNKAHRFSWAHHTQSEIAPGMMVCHSCDNPRCVNPAHLWLGEAKENVRDMHAKGRAYFQGGSLSHAAKLTESDVLNILADCRPYTAIAQEYGVTTMTISDIKCRRSWSHLEVDFIGHAPRVSPKRGKSERINPDIVREIRTSDARGVDLALKFSVSVQLITAIRKRRAWAHVN
jgi:hypothetical protein